VARITPGINKSASMSATHSLEKVSRFMPYERVEYKIQKNNKFKIPLFLTSSRSGSLLALRSLLSKTE